MCIYIDYSIMYTRTHCHLPEALFNQRLERERLCSLCKREVKVEVVPLSIAAQPCHDGRPRNDWVRPFIAVTSVRL